MYSVIDSDFFISCLYFIVAIIVLNFWIINLFVAVITNTFDAIRAETKRSAFGAAPYVPLHAFCRQDTYILSIASFLSTMTKMIGP